VTKAFIEELDDTNPPVLYRHLAAQLPVKIVIAKQDEILKDSDLTGLSDVAEVISIDGDHNFTGEDREGLIKALAKYI
jgi:surfactin synthase thioesterase subunit